MTPDDQLPTRRSTPSGDADRADYFFRDTYNTFAAHVEAGRNPIVIVGPPGSGKTALVRQFFESQKKKRPVRWIGSFKTHYGC